MKNLLTTAAIVLFSLGTMAQSYRILVKPSGSKTWGYANETGTMIVPAKYKKCHPFSESLAPIYESKNFFFIKPDGSLLNTSTKGFKLKKPFTFSEGLIAVQIGDKWGYLSTSGEMVIQAKYTLATPFNNGAAVVKKDTEFLIINKTGEETSIDVLNIKTVKPFSEGLAPVYNMSGNVGFINSSGQLAIEPRFLSAGYFVNGLAWAKNHTKQLGYINTKGEWVIDPKFMAGKDFDQKSGLARVKYQEKWTYVNMKGEMVSVYNTAIWGDFYDGLAKGKQNDKLGFYDNTGAFVIEPKFEGVRNFKNGFAAVKFNGKWGVINTAGEWVINPSFDGIKDMEPVTE